MIASASDASACQVVAPAHDLHLRSVPVYQAFDLYAERGTGPILMFVHGDDWSGGASRRAIVAALPDYDLRHCFTLASTSYRLAPAVSAG